MGRMILFFAIIHLSLQLYHEFRAAKLEFISLLYAVTISLVLWHGFIK